MTNDIFTLFQSISYKILINYKGEKINFTMKKPGRLHLIHLSKWKWSVMRQMEIMCHQKTNEKNICATCVKDT